jgi:hypothetical protein
MFNATHTTTKKFWQVALLACMLALPLSFTGSSSALAVSGPYTPPPNQCLHEGANVQDYENKPNEILATGQTLSVCGISGVVATVNQKITITNGCEGTAGTGSSTLYDNFSIPFGEYGKAQYDDKVGCVDCVYLNHMLVGRNYPNFKMIVTVDASGSYVEDGRTIPATSTGVSTAVLMVQNTGLYAPGCPTTD